MAVTNCHTYISVPYLIMAQLVIFLRERRMLPSWSRPPS